jgi:hypothetical protein
MVSKQVMLKKKGKRKSKKTTTTTKATASSRVINNIHINSKSGTRSKRQQRGGAGGYVAPSAASTISHVPLVMNVPAPDTTQRETQYIHAIKNVQDDIVALRALAGQAALQRQEQKAPDPVDTLRFQERPSVANQTDPPTPTPTPFKPIKTFKLKPKKDETGIKVVPQKINEEPSLPPQPTPPRSGQGVGLQAEEVVPKQGGSGSRGGFTPQRQQKQASMKKELKDKIDAGLDLTPQEIAFVKTPQAQVGTKRLKILREKGVI